MAEPTDNQNQDASPSGLNLQDLVTGLDFTPNWARGDASAPVQAPARQRERGGGRRDESSRGQGPRHQDRPRRDRDRGDQKRGEHQRGPREGGRPQGQGDRGRGPRREPRVFLPVDVNFIPDRDRLGAVVHHLHAIKRAFPLPYLANLFLVKPEYHLIKLEARAGKAPGETIQFYQDRESKVVFLSADELNDYLVRMHLDRHFDREEQKIDAPAGNFVCVGRCKRTGIIIGPPNYHGYNERVQEIHRTHFPHLPLDQYRDGIEMNREPAVIEKWKEEACTQVRYRPKDTPEESATLTIGQAEKLFMEKFAAGYVHTGSKIIMPATVMSVLSSEPLRQVINAARDREDRFPLSMMLAVRPAFRRMKLHLFRVGKDENYVTAILPKPLDAEHAIPSIKDMVGLIAEHPGWTRSKLVEKLYPGKPADDPEVVEKMSPLAWLVEKGHIIEFFNGSYAIPGHLRMAASAPTEQPQEYHHPELSAQVPAPSAMPLPPEDLPEPALPDDSPADAAPSQC